jgi:hypothetical protein
MNVTFDATRVTALLDKSAKALPSDIDAALFKTAQAGIQIITSKLDEGKGYKGRLKPYTPEYLRWKREKFGAVSSTVNLQLTNQMVKSIIPVRGRGFAEIKLSNPLANKKAYFNNLTRPFFGFSGNNQRNLVRFFKKAVIK